MTGAVLCGGQSLRMGTDKGLLRHGSHTWAELAYTKLSSLQIPAVVSINQKQLKLYAAIFNNEQLMTDDSTIEVKGPLLGLLSVHAKFINEDIFALACDMTDMTEPVLSELHNIYKKEDYEAYVYITQNKPQPLCGIYTAKGLQKIYELYKDQQLKKFSMMYVLERLNTKYVGVEEKLLKHFSNHNEKPHPNPSPKE